MIAESGPNFLLVVSGFVAATFFTAFFDAAVFCFFGASSVAEMRTTELSLFAGARFVAVFFAFAISFSQLKKFAWANCQVLVYATPIKSSSHATLNYMNIGLWGLIISGALSGFIAYKVAYAVQRYRGFITIDTPKPADDLPTISVCIPARNEMHALAQCLEHVLASDYEKLEILVLDDSSSDDTPHIIASFAHAGVRFIPGTPLPPGWLGKNHALATLADAASGDYLLFLDVDALISVRTISRLVAKLRSTNLEMLSLMPRRDDMHHTSALFGTARHMWELVWATATQPPSASTIWLIRRATLNELETRLSDYGSSVRPDHHIASALAKRASYRYYIGTRAIGVRYEKRLHSQIETAERLYFAMLGMSWLRLAIIIVSGILLLLPFFMLGTTWWLLALIALIIQYSTFALFTITTSPVGPGATMRMIVWPYVLVQDIVLLLFSAARYASHHVVWKGRNVTAQQRATAVMLDE